MDAADPFATTLGIFAVIFFIGLLVVIIALVVFAVIFTRRFISREEKSLDYILLKIKPPKYNEIKIEVAETLFNALHGLLRTGVSGLLKGQDHYSFEIVSQKGEIFFYISIPMQVREIAEKQIHSFYSDAEIELVPHYNIFSSDKFVDIAELSLKSAPYKPILRFHQLPEVDTLNSITSAMSQLEADESIAVQILVAPSNGSWSGAGLRAIHKAQTGSSDKSLLGNVSFNKTVMNSEQSADSPAEQQPEAKTDSVTMDPYKKIEEKCSKPGWESVIRIVVSANDQFSAKTYIKNMVSAFAQFNDPTGNGFRKRRWPWTLTKSTSLKEFIYRMMPFWFGKMILTSPELATIFHLPNKNITTPNISWALSKKVAAPSLVAHEGLYLGQSVFRGQKQKIHLLEDDRRRHMYVIGQTGTGKSEFLKFMAIQDIKEGKGVAFIDPHGSAVEDILNQIPKERAEDVIYFDAGDTERPMGLNILEASSEEQKNLVVNSFIALLYKLYDPKRTGIMGPRLERAVRNVMLTAMAKQGNTLVEVLRLLTDQNFVKETLAYVTDPLVRRYWTDEIAQTSDFHKSETMGYFVSKFDRFVTDTLLRNIIGQSKSAFDFRKVMDEKKILLVDLSKGKVGEENSNFLGLIMVPRLLIAAMSRVDMPEEERADFYLYVDEFQNFATPDFAQILSEARKYRLNLIVGNQFIAQIEENIREAIFGNVGSLISFRVGVDDAAYLEKQFEPVFKQQDLINNPIGNAYMRLLVKGQPTPPFSMATDWETMQQVTRNLEVGKAIRELSRLRFGRDKKIVEAEMERRSGLTKSTLQTPVAPPKPAVTSQISPQPLSQAGFVSGDVELPTAKAGNIESAQPIPIATGAIPDVVLPEENKTN